MAAQVLGRAYRFTQSIIRWVFGPYLRTDVGEALPLDPHELESCCRLHYDR